MQTLECKAPQDTCEAVGLETRGRHALQIHIVVLEASVSQSNQIQQTLSTPSRRIEELQVGERNLRSRSINYGTAFREKSGQICASVGGVRTRRAALRRTESAFTALAAKLDKLADGAREEEALRALVPAGSERWAAYCARNLEVYYYLMLYIDTAIV